jgi:hypothetical protein
MSVVNTKLTLARRRTSTFITLNPNILYDTSTHNISVLLFMKLKHSFVFGLHNHCNPFGGVADRFL